MHSFTQVYGIDVNKDNLDVLRLSKEESSKEKTQIKNRWRCIKCNAEKDNKDYSKLCSDQTSRLCISLVQVAIAQK